VPDGAEGLERLRAAAAGWYDLVITDAVMPHVSGQELLAEARRTDPTVACVLMSGHTRVDVPSDLEGLRFLEKPFSTSTLSDAIHEALGRHAPGTV
ncbi:MAG TPA: response regulator, partial [Longimicrobiales bacterium]|nr:response regulator [Longimicrobiales bacterium]